MILIPSDMIILKEKVAGYNNTLTLATKEMKFGVNEEVNKVPPPLVSVNENSKGPISGPFEKGRDSRPSEKTTLLKQQRRKRGPI